MTSENSDTFTSGETQDIENTETVNFQDTFEEEDDPRDEITIDSADL